MSAGFTPGPWQVAGTRHSGDLRIGRDARLLAVGPDGDAVAMVFFDMKTGRGHRDARLIAAAPELYEAASLAIPAGVCLTNRNIPDDFNVALDCTMGDLRKIAAALAKARGEA